PEPGCPPRGRLGHRLPGRDADRRRPRERGPPQARRGRPSDRDRAWRGLPPRAADARAGAGAGARIRRGRRDRARVARRHRPVPASLSGRILGTIALLAVVVWLAIGAALFVALRTMHAEETSSSLADIAQTFAVRVRGAVVDGDVRAVITQIRADVA